MHNKQQQSCSSHGLAARVQVGLALTRPALPCLMQVHSLENKIIGYEKRPIVVLRRRKLYAMMQVG